MRALHELYQRLIRLRASRDAAIHVIARCRQHGWAIPQDQLDLVKQYDRCQEEYQALRIRCRLERHCQGHGRPIPFLGPEKLARTTHGHRKNPNQVSRSRADLARRQHAQRNGQ